MKTRRAGNARRFSGAGAFANLIVLAMLLSGARARDAAAQEAVPVPGGPASYRRLFGLDPARPDADFFVDLHTVLLFGAPEDESWSRIESRRKAVTFAEDLSQWRELFGNPARFSTASEEERQRCERALDWLGFTALREGGSLVTRRRPDEKSGRRQSFLDVLGVSTLRFLGGLRDGGGATVAFEDSPAPLPFGLAVWREVLSAKDLTADNAFLFFLRSPRASRMLVALHALDPETRESLRALPAGASGRTNGWKTLYERSLDRFSRYPAALELSGGRFALPGGPAADPIWGNLFGTSPAEPAAFLAAFYEKDEGKAAYVVDSLRDVPEDSVRALLLPRDASEGDPVRRFRGIYQAIDPTGENYRRKRRDPYDLAQLAPFLRVSADPPWPPPIGDPNETRFPRDEAALADVVAREKSAAMPYDRFLRRLFERGGAPDSVGPFPAHRRFLFLSSFVERHPALNEPGLALLLYRGFDRFAAAYALFDDAPHLPPELARRYLFTLDRLERRTASREGELAAGLFEGSAALLARVARGRGLDSPGVAELLAALLDVPLFAQEDVSPGDGEAALFAWLDGRFLAALEAHQHGRRPEGAPAAAGGASEPAPSDTSDPDELVFRACAGPPAPAAFEWRGGRYRFDPAEDEISRRRAFRERQHLTWISDLEALHRARDAAASAGAAGDLEAMRTWTAELASGLGLAEGGASSSGEDERKEKSRARDAAEEIAAEKGTRAAERFPERLAALDALLARRHLEALLGHAYASSARDPEDLYYQDPSFVRRHSLATVEKGGEKIRSAFTPAELVRGDGGGGSLVAGSPFALTPVLGLLHADQLAYGPGVGTPSEEIRIGLVAPIWEMSVARLDDDSLEVVAASRRTAEELVAALADRPSAERLSVWEAAARGLVPRTRLAGVASLDDRSAASIGQWLSPSELYRIGRRLAGPAPVAGLPTLPSAQRARDAMARLESRSGDPGARELLAEFGPRPAAYAGSFRLADIEMPPSERLATYRRPALFCERLYDLKIVVASRLADESLPAAVLPVVLPAALDAMLARLRMAYPYDWDAVARAAGSFSREDLARILDEAIGSGRLVREENSGSSTGGAS